LKTSTPPLQTRRFIGHVSEKPKAYQCFLSHLFMSTTDTAPDSPFMPALSEPKRVERVGLSRFVVTLLISRPLNRPLPLPPLVDPTMSHQPKIVAIDNPACRYESADPSQIQLNE
jgi:hypothetical protein